MFEMAKRSTSTQIHLAGKFPKTRKLPERAETPARHPSRRATDFPTESTAIRAKNRPGDAVIRERTGKSWHEWFVLLNAAGTERDQLRKVIVANTRLNPQATLSWRNIVLLSYELDCRMREHYASPRGYEISTSRTVTASAAMLSSCWSKEKLRRRWLGDKELTVKEAVPDKSMKFGWESGPSLLTVELVSLEAGKTRVVVQHHNLQQRQVAPMKLFWTAALKDLKTVVEAAQANTRSKLQAQL